MMFIFFGEFNGFPFQKLPAFEVVGTKVTVTKSNTDNMFGYVTALLKIFGHYSIEMSIFVGC